MKGVYQQCGSQHLPRYLAEFDFRYSRRAALEGRRTYADAALRQHSEQLLLKFE